MEEPTNEPLAKAEDTQVAPPETVGTTAPEPSPKQQREERKTARKEARHTFFSKIKFLSVGILVGIALGIIGVLAFMNYNPPDAKPVTDTTVLKETLSQVNELATASYSYTIADSVKDSNTFYGVTMPFSESQFVVICSGEVKAGVNLDQVEIKANNKTITVKMPDPVILSNEVDPNSFEVVYENDSILNPFHMTDFTSWYKDHTTEMAERAETSGALDQAAKNAQSSVRGVLTPLLDGRELVFE